MAFDAPPCDLRSAWMYSLEADTDELPRAGKEDHVGFEFPERIDQLHVRRRRRHSFVAGVSSEERG